MSLICTDVITPAFERAKKFMLPFNLNLWLKLGFLSILVSSVGFNLGFNYKGAGPSDFTSLSNLWAQHSGIMIGGIVFLLLLGLFFVFISSILSFTLIKSVDTEQVLIKKNTKDTFSLGMSYFWFNIIMGFIVLIVFLLIALPFILPLLEGGKPDFSLAPILFFVLLAGIAGLILVLFLVFVKLFVIYHMYLTKKKFCSSIQASRDLLKKNFKEMFLFALIRFGMNIAITLGWVIIMLVLALPLLLVFGILAGLVYLIYLGLGTVTAIVLGVLFGLVALAILIVLTILIAAPIEAFITNYNLMFMKRMLALKN